MMLRLRNRRPLPIFLRPEYTAPGRRERWRRANEQPGLREHLAVVEDIVSDIERREMLGLPRRKRYRYGLRLRRKFACD